MFLENENIYPFHNPPMSYLIHNNKFMVIIEARLKFYNYVANKMKKYYNRTFERALIEKILKIVAEDLEISDKVHHFNLNEIRTIGSKLNK